MSALCRVFPKKLITLKYTFPLPPYGDVEVSVNSRGARLRMRVGADGVVRVSSPPSVPASVVADFVKGHTDFIDRALRREASRPGRAGVLLPSSSFHIRGHVLRMSPTSADGCVFARIGAGVVNVIYPPDVDPASDRVQQVARKAIVAAMREEARLFLPRRVAQLAAANGLAYSRVAVRDMRSQWGSCSSEGRICLNIQLMRLPDRLIDMVILHELAHTVHMDHGKEFYSLLDRLLGGRHAELSKELKTYSTSF